MLRTTTLPFNIPDNKHATISPANTKNYRTAVRSGLNPLCHKLFRCNLQGSDPLLQKQIPARCRHRDSASPSSGKLLAALLPETSACKLGGTTALARVSSPTCGWTLPSPAQQVSLLQLHPKGLGLANLEHTHGCFWLSNARPA